MQRESIYKRYEPAVVSDFDKTHPSYWFVFFSNKLLVRVDSVPYTIPYAVDLQALNLNPEGIHYLGTLEGKPCCCAEASTENPPPGMSFIELRPLYASISEELFLLAGKAVQIVAWDKTNQYCGRCGTPMEKLLGERAKSCPNCQLVNYPRLSPAVIVAILRDEKILLAHAKNFSGNMHSILAGFVEPGETLEECVKREVMEEVQIKIKNLQYFGSQPWPFPNSLMIGFTAEYESGEICVDGVEISAADWYDVHHLPELPSSFSIAREIIDWFIENHTS